MGRGWELYVLHHVRASWKSNVAFSCSGATAQRRDGFHVSRRLSSYCRRPYLGRSSNILPLYPHSCFSIYHRPLLSSTVLSYCSSASPDFSKLPGARKPKNNVAKSIRVLEITKEQANDAFKHCLELVRSRDRDNYQAVLTMPKVFHPELFALLAFNVELALVREKISAQHGTDAAGMYRLQFWRDALSAIYGDSVAPVPRQPVAIAL